MENYFLTNCPKENVPLMLEIAVKLGIKMHSGPAFDIDENPLKEYLAIYLDDGPRNLTEYWDNLAQARQMPRVSVLQGINKY
jgi:hypothetical protein